MDQAFTLFVLCGLFLCVTSLPVKTDDNVKHLVSLIKQLRDLKKQPSSQMHWYNLPLDNMKTENNQREKNSLIAIENPSSGILYRTLDEDLDATPIKRQGSWSYDYGLGGGRFGKRSFDEYGIGGGRFGRDVDHVDLADGVLDGE